MPLMLKFQLAGFFGVICHLCLNFLNDKSTSNNIPGIKTYFESNFSGIITSIISYEALYFMWHTGIIFVFAPYIPFFELSSEPIKVNYWIFIIAYCSSSIFKGLMGVFEVIISGILSQIKNKVLSIFSINKKEEK